MSVPLKRKVLVTGAKGFIGRNLIAALSLRNEFQIDGFDVNDDPKILPGLLNDVEVVFHLAGINRPDKEEDFHTGNAGFTSEIVERLSQKKNRPLIVFTSSIQADLDNPYGRSKRLAEETLNTYAKQGGRVLIYRLPNVFGKWSKPNYNSAVATFCYSIARGLEISVSDPHKELELVYVDDVVHEFAKDCDSTIEGGLQWKSVSPTRKISLGVLVQEIKTLADIRSSCVLPDLSDPFRRALLATYNSFLPEDGFAYNLKTNIDNRGVLAELLKTPHAGQVFVSRTKPGVTRGNHYHHTKVEKFCVLEGNAMIRFRAIDGAEVLDYAVAGTELRVVDIPPGYTHSIENVGSGDLITLFWSSEQFNKSAPDTYTLPVLQPTKVH